MQGKRPVCAAGKLERKPADYRRRRRQSAADSLSGTGLIKNPRSETNVPAAAGSLPHNPVTPPRAVVQGPARHRPLVADRVVARMSEVLPTVVTSLSSLF